MLHQDKMMSLGRLAASVAHEINNPLSGILNYARLMKRVLSRGEPSAESLEKFRGYLDLVESETDRCSRIISGLLAFSRRSEPEFTEVDPGDLIQRCALLSRHKMEMQNIELELFVPPDLPTVHGDRNQLQQCVINMVFNAIDATPPGGRITISGRADRAAGSVEIAVADTGTGIAPEDIEHIFEPFFTTKTEGYGVGLGLATVYGIVDRHNGRVDVRSTPGQGSVFTITLPCKACS